jgi:hypothetical protein
LGSRTTEDKKRRIRALAASIERAISKAGIGVGKKVLDHDESQIKRISDGSEKGWDAATGLKRTTKLLVGRREWVWESGSGVRIRSHLLDAISNFVVLYFSSLLFSRSSKPFHFPNLPFRFLR